MDRLKKKIETTEENDIQLKTRGVFRPITRQIGNSLADIKGFYDKTSKEGVTVVPSECPPHLKHYKDSLLDHLKAGSFLFKNNIVTGTEAAQPLLILMDSLALAMDLEVVARPSDVICDVLLAVCNQPVIVLTLVDSKQNSDALNEYNTSVAREVTGKIKTFMDERVCVVSGVCFSEDIEISYKFYDILKEHAQRSSFFIPLKTFETPLPKFNNIVTAIWASVAETNCVVKNEDIKRFLTMEQCVVLLENINKKEVKVYHKPGSGATTLMLEVARRLSHLNGTTLVTMEDEDRNSVLPPSILTSKELPSSDRRPYARIVVEDTGKRMQVTKQQRCWTFVQMKEDEKDPNYSVEVEYSHTKRASHQENLSLKREFKLGEGMSWTEEESKCLRKDFQEKGSSAKGYTFLLFGPTGHGKSSVANGIITALEDLPEPSPYHSVMQRDGSVSTAVESELYTRHGIIDMPGIFEWTEIDSDKKIVTGQIPLITKVTANLKPLDPQIRHDSSVECIILVLKYDCELSPELRRQIDVINDLCGKGDFSCHLVLTYLDECDPQFLNNENLPKMYESPKVLKAVDRMSKETGISPHDISFVKNYTTEKKTNLYSKLQYLHLLKKAADAVVDARKTHAGLTEEYNKQKEEYRKRENEYRQCHQIMTYHELFFFVALIATTIAIVYFG